MTTSQPGTTSFVGDISDARSFSCRLPTLKASSWIASRGASRQARAAG